MKFTSPVFSAVSGSIAGVTYSHNRGGMYTRARAVPTNPNTVRQQQVRANFNAAIEAWSSALTESQRAAWRTYAENVPVTNKLGATVTLTGQQMFIRAYSFAMQPQIAAVVTPSQDAPTTFDTGVTVWRVADTTTGGYNNIGVAGTLAADMDTDFDLTGDTPAAGALAIYVGPVQNPGVNFFKGPYRLSAVIPTVISNNQISWSTTQASRLDGYPAWEADQRVPLRARIIYADGRLSQPFEMILPVVDNST